ncbi:MAG: aminopeptidase P family protein, partial [Armatimonadetes bacterium]|nr:aminopeptidase P family protein [Armatimonadota bacterium]
MDYAGRQERVRQSVKAQDVDGLIVSSRANVRYLTGFTGEGLLFVGESVVLATDGRFKQEAAVACVDDVVLHDRGHWHGMAEVVVRAGARRAGFEAEKVTVADLEDITKKLGRVELVPLRKTVERLRRVKEGQEIELIRQAAAITDATLEAFMGQPDGRSEKMAAWEIVGLMLSRGADAAAFDPIVACGASAAEPHHEPGDQYVQPPGPLKIDMGAKYRGYCADLTRTYWLGEPDKQFRRIYTAVYQAQRKAIEEIRPGVACSYVDGLARRVIEEAGFGEAFSHGLGHGVGLEVH